MGAGDPPETSQDGTMPRTLLSLALLPLIALATGARAQDDSRAFGRIEPGGAPVEIADDAPPAGATWEPSGPISPALLEPAPAQTPQRRAQPVVPTRPADDPVLRMLEADLRAAEARTRTGAGAAEPVRPNPGDTASLPLGAPRAAQPLGTAQERPQGGSGWPDLARTGVALGAVLTLAFGIAWAAKKFGIAGGSGRVLERAAKSPTGLLEVLGRYPMPGRQSLIVLRFDQRVLLLSQRAGGDMTTLCELNDAEEVASVLLRVRDAAGDTAHAAFEEAISQADASYDDASDHDAWEPDPREQAEAMHSLGRVYTTEEGDRAELAFAAAPAGGREASLLTALRSRRA